MICVCEDPYTNPKKSNAQEIFWILKINAFRNDNFHAGRVVKENYMVSTFTFLQYYIKMLSISVKNKNELRIYFKKYLKKMQILWGLALYFLITCIGTE